MAAKKKKRARKFIQNAIKKPGALRASAKRMGVLREGEKLTSEKISKLRKKAKKSGNTKLLRRANLAKTLGKLRKKRKK